MSNPFEIGFYPTASSVNELGLIKILDQYVWPKNHTFVHVRPPKALNIPTNYFVGESIEAVDFDFNDLGDTFWYNIKKDEVLKAHLKSNTRVLVWKGCNCPRYVVDINVTGFPIGAFVKPDDDLTEILDMSEITEAQLSEAMQEADSKGVKIPSFVPKKKATKPKKKVMDLRELLDSLPDDDED